MFVTIDLNVLSKYKISPTEYVVLWLVDKKLEDQFPCQEVKNTLIDKGFILNGAVVSDIFSSQPEDWLIEWRNLWPKGIKQGGYALKSPLPDIRDRFTKFLKIYPNYTTEHIIEATKNYLNRMEENNWQYTKKASKFIYDREGSTLASEIEALLDGEQQPVKNFRVK